MPRRLTTLAAAASLLLCVATVALWVRSYWRRDQAGVLFRSETEVLVEPAGTRKRFPVFRRIDLISARGGMMLQYRWDAGHHVEGLKQYERSSFDYFSTDRVILYPKANSFVPEMIDHQWQRFGFGLSYRFWHGSTHIKIVFPLGLVVGITFILPGVVAMTRFQHWRSAGARRRGRCPTCGYDLRATPARCPECGAVPAAPAAR